MILVNSIQQQKLSAYVQGTETTCWVNNYEQAVQGRRDR